MTRGKMLFAVLLGGIIWHGAAPAQESVQQAVNDGLDMNHEVPIRRQVITPLEGAWTGSSSIADVKVQAWLSDDAGGGPQARRRATLRMSLTGPNGQPLSAHPLAWLLSHPNTAAAEEIPCQARISSAVAAGIANKPAANFNGFRLAVIDKAPAIGILDPQTRFSGTSLETVIPLPGVAGSFAQGRDPDSLLVSLPRSSAVAVVDLDARKVVGLLPAPPGSGPWDVAVNAAGDTAFVALENLGRVAIYDLVKAEQADGFEVPSGKIRLHVLGDRIAALSSGGKSLTLYRPRDHERLEVQLPFSPAFLADDGNHLFLGSPESAQILRVEAKSGVIDNRYEGEPGLSALVFDVRSRLILAANQSSGTLTAIDPDEMAKRAQGQVVRAPVEIGMSADYVYVRGNGTGFSLLERAGLMRGELLAVTIASGAAADDASPAGENLIAVAPNEQGIFVGDARSRVATFYMEGMNVPAGTVKLYAQKPQAILALDTSLRLVAPGVYETSVAMPATGRYDLAVALEQPKGQMCLPLTVASNAAAEAVRSRKPRVEMICERRVEQGIPTNITVTLRDGATLLPITGLRDVEFLAAAPPGNWQQRQLAEEVDPGTYRARWTFHRRGKVLVSVSSQGRGIGAADARPLLVEIQ